VDVIIREGETGCRLEVFNFSLVVAVVGLIVLEFEVVIVVFSVVVEVAVVAVGLVVGVVCGGEHLPPRLGQFT